MLRRQRQDFWFRHDMEVCAGRRRPSRKRAARSPRPPAGRGHGTAWIREHAARRKNEAARPNAVEERLAVKVDRLADQLSIGVVRRRPIVANTTPTNSGRSCVRKRQAGDDAEPAAAPFSAQKRSGFEQALAIRTSPSAVTTSASRRWAPADAVRLGKAAEPAAENQPGDADRHAAAALDIAAALGHHLVVTWPQIAPAPTETAGCGESSLAPRGDEGVVQVDVAMRRVQTSSEFGRVRAALIGVAAALHDEAEIVRPREVHRRDDVGGRFGGDRVDARARRPGADPAERLSQPDVVAEIVGVLEFLEDLSAGVRRGADASGERRTTLINSPSSPRPARSHASSDGQPGSPGERGRPGSGGRERGAREQPPTSGNPAIIFSRLSAIHRPFLPSARRLRDAQADNRRGSAIPHFGAACYRRAFGFDGRRIA